MFEVKNRLDKAHEGDIWCVVVKGDKIITGSVDGKVKVWNIDLQLITEINVCSLGIISVDLKDSDILVSSMDSHLRIYNSDTGELIKDIDVGPINTWQAKFQPGSDMAGTTGSNGYVNMWNLTNAELLKPFKPSSPTFSTCLCYTKDGNAVACCSKGGTVTIFDTQTGQPRTFSGDKLLIEAHTLPIRCTCFSPDGALLVTGSDDRHVSIFNTISGEKIATMSGHHGPILSCSFAPNGKLFATSSSDQKVKIWSVGDYECLTTLSHHTGQVWGVSWNYNSELLITISDDLSIIVYKKIS